MKYNRKNIRKEMFPLSMKDSLITLLILSLTTITCYLLKFIGTSDTFAGLIYILAVVIISRFTTGYLCGLISSFISLFFVNYVFTYPYHKMSLLSPNYPATFIIFLIVAILVCTMTTQIKEQEKLHADAELERMRANLLRAISHDLRTPLTSIIGSSSVILDNYGKLTPQECLKLVGEVKEDAAWLLRIVENLLSITRISEGVAHLHKQPEIAEEIIADAIQKMKVRHPHIHIEVDIPHEIIIIPMDGILIEQVILNLLENAIKHSHTATKYRLVLQQNDTHAIFIISDNGNGIPKQKLEHIFDGNIVNNAEISSDTNRNMGIGLSVCMSIIKAHNGTMSATNDKKNGGAIFTFKLPLQEEHHE